MSEAFQISNQSSDLHMKLNDLLGDLTAPAPFVQLVGMPGTGKTSFIKSYLRSLKSASVYLDCSRYCYDPLSFKNELLYKGILQQLRRSIILEHEANATSKNSKHFKNNAKITTKIPGRIGTSYNFFSHLYKILSQSPKGASKYSVVLVFDNIQELIEISPNLVCSILRHREFHSFQEYQKESFQTRGIALVFISRNSIPPELCPGNLTPLTIKFDSYTREQAKEIFISSFDKIAIPSLFQLPLNEYKLKRNELGDYELSITCKSHFTSSPIYPSEEIKMSSQKLKELWSNFVNDFVNITFNEYKSDFREMSFLCRQMWIIFLNPIAQINLRGEIKNIATRLKKDLGPHIRKALSRPSSHFTSDLYDPSFLSSSLQKSLATTLVIELSLFGKILITAAAIASSTHQSNDIRIFDQCLRLRIGNKRKSIRPKESKKFQQNPFTLLRWISIADTLHHIMFDKAIEFNPFLDEQISSLVRMRLVLPWNTIEHKKGSRRGLNTSTSIARFSNLPFFDPFGQPFLPNSSKIGNPQRVVRHNELTNLHDPETRLFCQVPFDLIHQITKTLPGVKIEELI